MSNEEAPDRTIDKLHRETGIPMWALEIAFDLSTRGMLDEETMAGMRVIPDAARVIAESVGADLLTTARKEEREATLKFAIETADALEYELPQYQQMQGAEAVRKRLQAELAKSEAAATTEKGENNG